VTGYYDQHPTRQSGGTASGPDLSAIWL